ncbi:MAG TPA: hypothetical protein VMF69_14395 [Gemmataceae bacterium]|nr:hypothetical protein [Gemmataceae bacterium]
MDKDLQYIKILSIFYFVVGGLLALFSCFALIYLFMGVMFLNMPPTPGAEVPPPPPEIGWIFIVFSIAALLVGWVWAAALMVAGWFLGRCRHYLYCMVMGCSALLFQPFGTVLGVFTIILLIRPNVKRLFETGGQVVDEEETDDFDHHFRRDSYNIRR